MEHNKDIILSPQINTQFAEITTLIARTRDNVIRIANTAMIDLYWNIGQYISEKIKSAEWGENIVQKLAEYISKNAPEAKGFSDKNLWRMKQFYETYSSDPILSPVVREISWTNNLVILSRTKSIEERSFYLRKCVEERYSKRELERQISSALFERTCLDNKTLPPIVDTLAPAASSVFRDNYVLEFVAGKKIHNENSLRMALISQMKDFILEIGKDFIYIDQEYRLQVGNSDFRIDLLFYHRELQCLVAFELKMEKFKPEHLGQLNFYLEALDRDVKKPKENPSIGVLLCKDKDNDVVEYALSRSLSPTLVAEYQLCLPDKKLLRQKMQEIEDFQNEEEQ